MKKLLLPSFLSYLNLFFSFVKNVSLKFRRTLQTHYLAQIGLKIKTGDEVLPSKKTPLEHALEERFILKVKTLLEADLQKHWTVTDLAQQLHISTSQLYRKLEALTGMHTTEFVRYVRLINARQLLLDTPEESISSIAYKVGFTSPNEFNRRFKEVFHVTPSQWRKSVGF